MIEFITLADVATYSKTPETMLGLSQFNFIFGSNGAGKTTVSRVIADESKYPECKVVWKSGSKLEAMVYNRDFIDRVLMQSPELPGVFTLGEKQNDTLAKIAAAKKEQDELSVKIDKLKLSLQGTDGQGGEKGKLETLDASFTAKCWVQKQKHDAKFQGAFDGYRKTKESFKNKVLKELASNTASLKSLAELQNKAEVIYGPTPTSEGLVSPVDTETLITHESNPILKKRVIGKEDVDIAAMIKKLGNSDWVSEGRAYYDVNDLMCPFCQQSTPKTFAQSLNEYFDETFVADSRTIDVLATNYKTDAERLQLELDAIIAAPSRFLDLERLKAERELLGSRVSLNIQRLDIKKKEASQIVELESLANVSTAINDLIVSANAQIAAHNSMVANLDTERRTLTSQIWRFVVEELKTDLAEYAKEKEGLDKAISGMTVGLESFNEKKANKSIEIRELEKQTTSIVPTIDAINTLLGSFGFQGFMLAEASVGASYKLVRPDGSDAKNTLSEGERSFITFLYFFHLLKGSESDSGMTTDRIVVFDDPVSSLDSDILFIVGSLIKGLFAEIRAGGSHIKQILVLTHNVYFHKEVSYKADQIPSAFWVIRKSGQYSKIERHQTNPIKTSYELLWAEVRNPDRSNVSIQNTLRRILEHYFKILGGMHFDDLCDLFEGREKMICNSLLSWVHNGSHYAHDDICYTIDHTNVDAYLTVFRAIFDKSNHSAHYKMMMNDAFVEDTPVAATA